jgi:hypothetical protein
MFTDISCPPNNDITMSNSSQSQSLLCQRCDVIRRSDVFHCGQCGVCSELHDHHCDILQICICAKNYKYFILFAAYASLQCIATIFSIIKLNLNITNSEILRFYGMRNMMGIIGFGFFGLILAALCIIILSDAPYSESHDGGRISR